MAAQPAETPTRTVGLFEAKTHLSELVSEVEAGGSILLTRRGRPVARIVPIRDDTRQRRARAVREMAILRAELNASGTRLTVDEILAARDEGRR